MSSPEIRSSDLARLAGVSIRTLRHYHQIGLLSEPDRSANGYRRYTPQHLATMLRIARFTELGIPLSEVGRVLDDPEASARMLEELDAQAALEIERLAQRRARIAELAGGVSPDTPAALIPFASLITHGGAEREVRFGREQMALIEHLSEDRSLPWLVAVAAHFARSDRYLAVADRLAELPEGAAPSEIADLGDALAELLRDVTVAESASGLSPSALELLAAHQDSYLNAAQRAVIRRLVERLEEPGD